MEFSGNHSGESTTIVGQDTIKYIKWQQTILTTKNMEIRHPVS